MRYGLDDGRFGGERSIRGTNTQKLKDSGSLLGMSSPTEEVKRAVTCWSLEDWVGATQGESGQANMKTRE